MRAQPAIVPEQEGRPANLDEGQLTPFLNAQIQAIVLRAVLLWHRDDDGLAPKRRDRGFEGPDQHAAKLGFDVEVPQDQHVIPATMDVEVLARHALRVEDRVVYRGRRVGMRIEDVEEAVLAIDGLPGLNLQQPDGADVRNRAQDLLDAVPSSSQGVGLTEREKSILVKSIAAGYSIPGLVVNRRPDSLPLLD